MLNKQLSLAAKLTGTDLEVERAYLLARWARLRRVGLCVALLQEQHKIWTYDPVGRWDSKEHMSWEQLELMVDVAECLVLWKSAWGQKRKDIGAAYGMQAAYSNIA